jgi:hypothetical protein
MRTDRRWLVATTLGEVLVALGAAGAVVLLSSIGAAQAVVRRVDPAADPQPGTVLHPDAAPAAHA